MANQALSNDTFHFELITPSEVLLDLDVNQISAHSTAGEIGILPQHTDLITQLESAPVRYWNGKEEKFVAVLGGVLEVKNNKVTIISDFAEKEEDIDEAKAHKEAKIAEAELSKVRKSHPEQREQRLAEARLQKELLKLKTLQRKKGLN